MARIHPRNATIWLAVLALLATSCSGSAVEAADGETDLPTPTATEIARPTPTTRSAPTPTAEQPQSTPTATVDPAPIPEPTTAAVSNSKSAGESDTSDQGVQEVQAGPHDFDWSRDSVGCRQGFRQLETSGNKFVDAGQYAWQLCDEGTDLLFIDLDTGQARWIETSSWHSWTGAALVTVEAIPPTATSDDVFLATYHYLADGSEQIYEYDRDVQRNGYFYEDGLRIERTGNWHYMDTGTTADFRTSAYGPDPDLEWFGIDLFEFETDGNGNLFSRGKRTAGSAWNDRAVRRHDHRDPSQVIWTIPGDGIKGYLGGQIFIGDLIVSIDDGTVINGSEASYSFRWQGEDFDESFAHRGRIYIESNNFLARVDADLNEIWSIPENRHCEFSPGEFGLLIDCNDTSTSQQTKPRLNGHFLICAHTDCGGARPTCLRRPADMTNSDNRR